MTELLIKETPNNIKKTPLTAKVISNVQLSGDIYQITMDCQKAAIKAVPGQFISILCENLVLRRPFSIADSEGNLLQIIYKVKGIGTQYIAGLQQGDMINILGPLGKGFNISGNNSILVAGGVGIAPLMFLSKVLEKRQISYTMLAGFRENINIPGINYNKSSIITEDGSSHIAGRVTDYLDKAIEHNKPQKIYACGPEIVLKQVVDIASRYEIPTEVALEKKFACGTGVCMGCVVKIQENGKICNKRICKDGPVFDGRSVIW